MPVLPAAGTHEADVAVVGAGAAGLYAALCAAADGARVVLISATPLAQTASYWAQGGLAAALAADDSFELHLRDTELAGRGLVRRSAAASPGDTRRPPACATCRRSACASTPTASASSRSASRAGTRCGASSTPAAAPPAGASFASSPRWQPASRASRFSRARAHRRYGARTSRCRGVVCDDGRVIAARAVVIATGGAAALWARTTNPPGSQGVGLLLAHAAGAALADLEMLQFHPTAVIGVRGREGFLVTEAIRGEGATLHDARGERFVDELAPRDEVSRAIHTQLSESGEPSVGLDMRAIDPAHFPNVVASLREAGLDPTRELIPVAPAAHYMMGGIVADLNARSTLPGLYAVGESSCTGLHGANRLASNSLSECFVFARRAVADALSRPAEAPARAERARAADAACVARAGERRRRGARGAVARRRCRAHTERPGASCSTTHIHSRD